MEHNFSDIELAFDSVSFQMQSSCSAFLSETTGAIFYLDDGTGECDELPDDFDSSDDYLEIPHKNDLDLGVRMVHRFVGDMAPELSEEVRAIFSRRGAYSRFKSLLAKQNLLDAWHAYEQNQMQAALKQWCEDNGVKLAPASRDSAG